MNKDNMGRTGYIIKGSVSWKAMLANLSGNLVSIGQMASWHHNIQQKNAESAYFVKQFNSWRMLGKI